MDYFDEQNVKFYDFLNENFKINKEKNWDSITKNITVEKIKIVLTPIKQEYYSKFRLLFMRLIFSLKLDVYLDSISLLA